MTVLVPRNLVRARCGLKRPMREWTNGLDILVQGVLDGYVPEPLAKICRLHGSGSGSKWMERDQCGVWGSGTGRFNTPSRTVYAGLSAAVIGEAVWARRPGLILGNCVIRGNLVLTGIDLSRPFLTTTPRPTHTHYSYPSYSPPPNSWGTFLAENSSKMSPVSPYPLFPGITYPSAPPSIKIGGSMASNHPNSFIWSPGCALCNRGAGAYRFGT